MSTLAGTWNGAIETVRILIPDGWNAQLLSMLGVLTVAAAALLVLGTYQFRRHTASRAD